MLPQAKTRINANPTLMAKGKDQKLRMVATGL